jgi:UDP-glucose 4-epimerase
MVDMKALVTGGAGFIGSHLVERLLGLGDEVRVVDNFSTGKRANLEPLEAGPYGARLEVVEADVRNAWEMRNQAAGCEVIFHEAAIVSVPYSVEHPQETHDVNLQGTLNVLEAARHARTKRLVFASSAAVYGDAPGLPKHEGMLPAPISPYGLEKLTSEHYLAIFARLYGVETVSLRYFNVFGPRQDPTSAYSGVISIFADRARRGDPVTIFGDGSAYRDFVFVADVVAANLLAATTSGISGRAFNVARGEKTTLVDLVRMVGAAVGRELHAKHEAARAGDIAESIADITRARAELGYAPNVAVEEGLRLLLA